jgi:hypothetical protein
MVMFVCYLLRIIADEEARGGDNRADISSSSEVSDTSDDESSSGSEYSDTSDGESSSGSSDGRNSRWKEQDLLKDARELFL